MAFDKDNGETIVRRYSRRMKLHDDEVLAKGVFTDLGRASKSTFNYKKNNKNINANNSNRSKEVLVKITGNSKNMEGLKAHINYITRKGKLEIEIDENEIYKGKEDNEFVKDIFNEGSPILSSNEIIGKEKREVMHIVFSMKEHETTPKDKLMIAVMKTVKEKYPNNISAFTYHGDTDNPHIHTILKVADNEGKRIDIRKKDLAEFRIKFAQELNKLGIEAKATIKRDYEKADRKNHHYKVVDFGYAKYQFSEDKNEQDSYFVKYETKKGTVDIWSKDLANVVKLNNIEKGDFAKFKIVGKEPVTININKKVNGKNVQFKKETYKSIWDCSILGKDEKELKEPIRKKRTARYSFVIIKSMLAQFQKSRNKNISEKSKNKFINKIRSKEKKRDIER